MANTNLAEVGGEVTKTLRQAMRRRPLSSKTKTEYQVLAFELENQLKEIQRKLEERSFSPR